LSGETRYDLGTARAERVRLRSAATPKIVITKDLDPTRRSLEWLSDQIAVSAALAVPGAGQMIRGRRDHGLFFISWFALLATLGWALLNTAPRIGETLVVLDLPRGGGIWGLALVYSAAAALYVGNIALAVPATAARVRTPVHPALAGAASAVLPGWGQLLNGDFRRAAVLAAGLWLSAAAWILVMPATGALLLDLDLYLPARLAPFVSPTVRWTVPAVVWAIAIYDAVASSMNRRAGASG